MDCGRRILLGNGYLKTSPAGTWAGRDRSFAYRAYLDCLRTGTELDSGG